MAPTGWKVFVEQPLLDIRAAVDRLLRVRRSALMLLALRRRGARRARASPARSRGRSRKSSRVVRNISAHGGQAEARLTRESAGGDRGAARRRQRHADAPRRLVPAARAGAHPARAPQHRTARADRRSRSQGARAHRGARRRDARRRGGQPGQERVPRQHEPRDPHAAERHHRHDRAGARHRRSRPSSAST